MDPNTSSTNRESDNTRNEDVPPLTDKPRSGEEASKSSPPLTRQDIPAIVSAVIAAAFPKAKALPSNQSSSSATSADLGENGE